MTIYVKYSEYTFGGYDSSPGGFRIIKTIVSPGDTIKLYRDLILFICGGVHAFSLSIRQTIARLEYMFCKHTRYIRGARVLCLFSIKIVRLTRSIKVPSDKKTQEKKPQRLRSSLVRYKPVETCFLRAGLFFLLFFFRAGERRDSKVEKKSGSTGSVPSTVSRANANQLTRLGGFSRRFDVRIIYCRFLRKTGKRRTRTGIFLQSTLVYIRGKFGNR